MIAVEYTTLQQFCTMPDNKHTNISSMLWNIKPRLFYFPGPDKGSLVEKFYLCYKLTPKDDVCSERSLGEL